MNRIVQVKTVLYTSFLPASAGVAWEKLFHHRGHRGTRRNAALQRNTDHGAEARTVCTRLPRPSKGRSSTVVAFICAFFRRLLGGAADEISAEQGGLYGGQEVGADAGFCDEAAGTQAERFVDYFGRRFLAHEEDFGTWGTLADEAGGVESVEGGQADVEEDEAGLKFGGLLNGFLAVGYLGDDVKSGLRLQQAADEFAKGFEIFDYDNTHRIFHESGAHLLNYLYGVM